MSPEHELPLEPTLYQVKKTIVGQDGLLERMLVALLARGHLLVLATLCAEVSIAS